jgi:hypothetical protein
MAQNYKRRFFGGEQRMTNEEMIARLSSFYNNVMLPTQRSAERDAPDTEDVKMYLNERSRDCEAMKQAIDILMDSEEKGEVTFTKEFFEAIYIQSFVQYMKNYMLKENQLMSIAGQDKGKMLMNMALSGEYRKFSNFYEVLFCEKFNKTFDDIMKDVRS